MARLRSFGSTRFGLIAPAPDAAVGEPHSSHRYATPGREQEVVTNVGEDRVALGLHGVDLEYGGQAPRRPAQRAQTCRHRRRRCGRHPVLMLGEGGPPREQPAPTSRRRRGAPALTCSARFDGGGARARTGSLAGPCPSSAPLRGVLRPVLSGCACLPRASLCCWAKCLPAAQAAGSTPQAAPPTCRRDGDPPDATAQQPPCGVGAGKQFTITSPTGRWRARPRAPDPQHRSRLERCPAQDCRGYRHEVAISSTMWQRGRREARPRQPGPLH